MTATALHQSHSQLSVSAGDQLWQLRHTIAKLKDADGVHQTLGSATGRATESCLRADYDL